MSAASKKVSKKVPKKVSKGVPEQTQIRAKKLHALIEYHRQRYHTQDSPEITDEAYDSLVREMQELEAKYPSLQSSDSPTQKVGGDTLPQFQKVRHEVRQWSFDNVFTHDEFNAWHEKVLRALVKEGGDPEKLSYLCEHKIDGLKIILTYKQGKLITGATRGDGEVGEDITRNLETIGSIPKKLKKPIDCIVGGEAWLSHAEFERINIERKKDGKPLFANARNSAAGTLRQLDPKLTAQRKLDCFVYDLYQIDGVAAPKTQQAELALLQQLGFHTNIHAAKAANVKEVHTYYDTWLHKREKQPFEMDGIVVKVDSLSLQERLGYTGKAPRFAIAFKFPAQQVTTKVEGIALQVGRTGVITPVAHLSPTLVAGSTVSRATLHNEDQIKRLDVRVGDTVVLQKAGDVIPEIVSVVKELRSGKEKKFTFPKKVAGCGGDGSIERIPGEAAYRCVDKNSFEQKRRGLHHAISRKALNMDGLGEKTVDLLLEKGLIDELPDLFTLTYGDLEGLPGFKEKAIRNTLEAIALAKKSTLPRLLFSLGIEGVGEETARDLAKAFGDIASLQRATEQELNDIEGIGEVLSSTIAAWFKNPENRALVKQLVKHITLEAPKQHSASTLTGKTFVLTGVLASMSRDEASERIRNQGGSVSSSVSGATDFVVAGEKPGSKFANAKKLGVTILDEAAFLKLLSK